ncbi:MAG TPA: hypothetical protein PLL20_16910 [Phycisphaerae bacterium]|nr:hypothetical protein [Phycisphaerae bacterium]HRR85145.1 hypothetical protein [Phycisphaerae bacterium]
MKAVNLSSDDSEWRLGGLNGYAVILAVVHLVVACPILVLVAWAANNGGMTGKCVPLLAFAVGPFVVFAVYSGLFRLIAGRWTLVPNFAFLACVAGVWFVGATKTCQTRMISVAQAEQTHQNLSSQVEGLTESLRAFVEKTGQYRMEAKPLANYLKAAEAAGLPRPAVEECCNTAMTLLKEERHKRAVRHDAISRLNAAGGTQAKTITSRKDAESRLKLAQQILKAAEDVQQHMTSGSERIRDILVKAGINGTRLEQLRGCVPGYGVSAEDKSACTAMLEYDQTRVAYFSLLADKWGQWQWDRDRFASSDPAIVKEYKRLSDVLGKTEANADLPPRQTQGVSSVNKTQNPQPVKNAQNANPARKSKTATPAKKAASASSKDKRQTIR